ncbi:MAG: transketolase [Candidatus Taylorbacteria bacterium]|nr:transketolase [Candidatus Taylorbacteria bacterium]
MNYPIKKINSLKSSIVLAAHNAGEGHVASAFSILDILWVLYDLVLRFNPLNPKDPQRDIFILSKGHASLALYAVLAEKGFFEKSELERFAKFDSILGGHPDRNKIPGVEASTGSLGHGLPMAIGVALGLKISNSKAKVFTLIGDGEANEGTVWESALLATHHKLTNLICIVDYNHSTDRALSVGDLSLKFEAFGWKCLKINGHNHKKILKALSSQSDKKPIAIIAETIKGFGSKTMEHNPAWHHKSPNKEELEIILKELK